MDHADLVDEMHTVENLPTQDRLHLARMRRAQQLKVARQKEKEWQKLQSRRDRAQQHSHKNRRHITFENSVVLLEAAGRNDINEVAHLLQRGITPDASNEDGLTALHQCCIDNNIEMLKLLLDYGANVDAQDSDKWTPLHAAATCGHLNLVKILISRGANLLAVNTDGNMPYDLCDDEETLDYIEAEMSKRGVTQELIDETRALTERQMLNDLMEIASNVGDLEEPDNQGATPLHIASANGYTRVVEFLLEHHVSVDAIDKDLWSPVHAAACWGHLEVLELLAQYGADLNAKNKDDETPSDICEDAEIRERIEQLRTEQESKRLAEAQRRRVRRSQSNNTRAQSVRRTSLRDKTLTTKKDAVEETRLRLQAQEVFITPDSTTDPKSINNTADQELQQQQRTNNSGDQTTTQPTSTTQTTTQTATTTATSTSTITPPTTLVSKNNLNLGQGKSSSSSSSSTTTPPTTSQSQIGFDITTSTKNDGQNQALTIGKSTSLNNNINNHNNSTILNHHHHNHNINNINNNNNNNNTNNNIQNASQQRNHHNGNNKNSYGNAFSNNATTPTSHQSHHDIVEPISTVLNSRRPPEGKDNEEFGLRDKMLIANSNSVSNLHKLTNDNRSTEVFSAATKENGKINVQVTVLVDTHNLDNALSGTTLANLKKQRSQSRSSTVSENGSVIGGSTGTSGIIVGQTTTSSGVQTPGITMTNSTSRSGGMNSSSGIDLGMVIPSTSITSSTSQHGQQTQPVTKFSGVTSDVVSDSTRSKKCCLLM